MPRGGISKRGANSTQSGRSRRPTNSSVGPVSLTCIMCSPPPKYSNHPMLPFPGEQQATLTNAAASSSGSRAEPFELNFDIDALLLQTGTPISNLALEEQTALVNYREGRVLTGPEEKSIKGVKMNPQAKLRNLMSLCRRNLNRTLESIPDHLRNGVTAQFATYEDRLSAACDISKSMYEKNYALEEEIRDQAAQIATQNTAFSNLQKRNSYLERILGMSGFSMSNIEGLDGSSSQVNSELPPSRTQPDSNLWPDQSDCNPQPTNSTAPPAPWEDIDQYLPLEDSEAALQSWMALQRAGPEASGHYAL
nr:hypothetical protein L204_06315 [Cryptococcus depauperatus CBS 7855]